MEGAFKATASLDDLKIKNQIYNDADSEIWRKTVYEPVHDGWAFTNIGGRDILRSIGDLAKLGSGKQVLELCCGLGATCSYLNEKYGCRVTGIDINSFQIQSARERYNPSSVETDLNFILADIVTWQPREFYDAIFVMDSLTLIERPELIINKSAQHLAPHGLLAISEVTAGPGITNEIRQLCWEEDGFINLIGGDQYGELLLSSGLSSIEVVDRTDLAYECFSKIHTSVVQHKQMLVDIGGEMLYDSWLNLNAFYLNCFENGQLNYTFATAWQR